MRKEFVCTLGKSGKIEGTMGALEQVRSYRIEAGEDLRHEVEMGQRRMAQDQRALDASLRGRMRRTHHRMLALDDECPACSLALRPLK